jgi:hypothetical protein
MPMASASKAILTTLPSTPWEVFTRVKLTRIKRRNRLMSPSWGSVLSTGLNPAIAIGRVARWLARQPPVVRASRVLPGPLRRLVRQRVDALATGVAPFDLPTRLSFPEAASAPGPHRRVVVYGAFFPGWNVPLIDPALWRPIAGVTEVLRIVRPAELAKVDPTEVPTVLVPLGEQHIRHRPAGYRSLVPDDRCLGILSDKARFAAFMAVEGLAGLCPATYRDDAAEHFPCVLKRLDLNAAYGVELVKTVGQLQALLASDVFRGHPHLLQAFVPGDTEYATHCVCKDGEILWSCSFARAMGSEPRIGGLAHDTVAPFTLSPRVHSQIEGVVARLGYSGPCCIDHKIRDNGDIAIFEINPRFGGSLMVPANRAFLGQAMASIIANAR